MSHEVIPQDILTAAQSMDEAVTSILEADESPDKVIGFMMNLGRLFQQTVDAATAPLLQRIYWLENAPTQETTKKEPAFNSPTVKIPHAILQARERFGLVIGDSPFEHQKFFSHLTAMIDAGAPFVEHGQNDCKVYMLMVNGQFALVIRAKNDIYVTITHPHQKHTVQHGGKAMNAYETVQERSEV